MRPILVTCVVLLVGTITANVSLRAGESDDLWGRALLEQLSHAPQDNDIAHLFENALEKATEKAPLYVAYGDYQMLPSFRQFMTSGNHDISQDPATKLPRTQLESYQKAVQIQNDYSLGWFRIAMNSDADTLKRWVSPFRNRGI